MKRIRFTSKGYEALKKEYDTLLKSRPEAVGHLKKAREMGDLSENGYYKASRAKVSAIDHRLFQIKMYMKQAIIVNDSKSNTIGIGSRVTLSNNEKLYCYEIAGDMEANPAEGKLSLLSPIGRALEGKRGGDKIEVKSLKGNMVYKIENVE